MMYHFISKHTNFTFSRLCRHASQCVVAPEEVERFYKNCLTCAGAEEHNATLVAENMLAADYMGRFCCGVTKLSMYVCDLKQGLVDGKAKPEVLHQNNNTALVDGKNALGPVVGNFCMDLAIDKATNSSMAWVAAKHSNEIGLLSAFACKAMRHGLLSLAFSNSAPFGVPTNAKKAALGANRIASSAPAEGCDSFLIDMFMTNMAVNLLELFAQKGQQVPDEVALDRDGKITTDPKVALDAATLLPLGGLDAGHKGYGLLLMIEVLCGILTDAPYGPHVRKYSARDSPACLAQSFMCLNPECFAPCYNERLTTLMDCMRCMESAEPANPVQAPGDWERRNTLNSDEKGGIAYEEFQIKQMKSIAEMLRVEPMKFS